MNKQVRKLKALGILFLFQICLSSCQTRAESSPLLLEESILFDKNVISNNHHHRLLVSKNIIASKNKESCEIEGICNTAFLNINYTVDNHVEWKYKDIVKDCSYDITLDVFIEDIVFDFKNGFPNIIVGYEKLCSSSFDPTAVIIAGYENKNSYIIDSQDTTTKYSMIAKQLFEKLIKKRKTYFLDTKKNLTDTNKDRIWEGRYTFTISGIEHMGESHDFHQTIVLTKSSCKLKVIIDDESLDSEYCSVISSNQKEIFITTNEDKEYKITKDGANKFHISGSAIYLLNPPTQSYPLTLE